MNKKIGKRCWICKRTSKEVDQDVPQNPPNAYFDSYDDLEDSPIDEKNKNCIIKLKDIYGVDCDWFTFRPNLCTVCSLLVDNISLATMSRELREPSDETLDIFKTLTKESLKEILG